MTLSKRAVDWNRRGKPRGGGRGHDRRCPGFSCNFLVNFFAFAFCDECGWGTTTLVFEINTTVCMTVFLCVLTPTKKRLGKKYSKVSLIL